MLNEIRVSASAKINLGLKVFPRRSDGFHNIEGIFQKIALADELFVRRIEKQNVCYVSCEKIALPEQNTITLAYNATLNVLHRNLPGVSVELTKRIPLGGGLGGGSSDAASLIYAICALDNFTVSVTEADKIASMVGSDVFFFMHALGKENYAAIVTGRGENIRPILAREDLHFLLVFPGVHSSTAEAYSLLDKFYQENGFKENEGTDFNQLEKDYNRLPLEWSFKNSFTPVISKVYPLVSKAIFCVRESGALFTEMSGSGDTVFGVYDSKEKAQNALIALSNKWQDCKMF